MFLFIDEDGVASQKEMVEDEDILSVEQGTLAIYQIDDNNNFKELMPDTLWYDVGTI